MTMLKRLMSGTARPAGCFLIAVLSLMNAEAQTPPTAPASASRGTNDPHAEAVELLRKVIQEQQRYPDRIIRVPSSGAPTAGKGATGTTAPPRPDRAELERQFLDGRITAKQFQRALEDLEKNPPPPAPAATATGTPGTPTKGGSNGIALSPKAAAAVPGRVITNQPVTVITTPEEAPEHKTLSDVEAKIDEILARRQAQIDAAKTNAPADATGSGPMTKRQKLDALLRSLIQGKITEAEYNAQREKILASPD